MKSIYASLAFIAVFTLSCNPDSEEKVSPKGEYSFYITGINESLSYTFSPSNGRVAESVPEDVKALTLLVLDENDELVYNQHYYNHNYYYDYADSLDASGEDYYYYENAIPDTLFIPALPEGVYTVLTATTDFYYYRYHDGFGPEGNEARYPKLDSYTISEGPIYVGKEVIELKEEDVELKMPMKNVSTKITLKKKNADDNDLWVDMSIRTKDASEYDFKDDALVASEHGESTIYAWIDYGTEKSVYALPSTIDFISLHYYDYRTGTSVSQEVDIDPDIEMSVGDAITFTIDMEALADGSGSAIFDWEDIDWNDLGDITVP
jgi:hypothetical protein